MTVLQIAISKLDDSAANCYQQALILATTLGDERYVTLT